MSYSIGLLVILASFGTWQFYSPSSYFNTRINNSKPNETAKSDAKFSAKSKDVDDKAKAFFEKSEGNNSTTDANNGNRSAITSNNESNEQNGSAYINTPAAKRR